MLSRRQLLMATGLSGASYFLPSLLSPRQQAAAQANPIKRLLILTSDHGTVRDKWWMRRDAPDYGNFEYPFDDADPMSFSEILRPLHAYRDQLLVVEGLSMASALNDVPVNNHTAGYLHLLTGATMAGEKDAGGPSVDQLVARHVAVPGRIASIETTAGTSGLNGFSNIDAGVRTPQELFPDKLFDRLFPGEFSGSTPTERDLIGRAQGSVLDLVAGQYDAMAPRLGAEDRKKLENHRDMIRDLELQISGLANLVCDRPASQRNGDKLTNARIFADLTAAAFACDITRVATLSITQLGNDDFGAPPGDVHQDFAHATDDDPFAAEQMTNYNRVHAEFMRYTLDALSAYSDGGGSLLDNTLVVWMTELATGPHDLDRIPIVMAGSCAGHFNTGRYVCYAQDLPNPRAGHEEPMIGPGHNQLLVSIMQAMGLPNNEIGQTLAGSVPLTGPLPRLT